MTWGRADVVRVPLSKTGRGLRLCKIIQGHKRTAMLPGFRILLAFTMLSVSIVIFALGAAAFLRSAHEDVANAPWRPIETPVTARVDLAPATLAMLRVEPETPPTLPATNAEPAATIAPPAEIKPQVTKVDAADVAALPAPRVEQATPPAARIAEEPAKPTQAEPPLAPQPAVAASDALHDAAPPAPIEAKPAETRPTDATVTETKAAETTTVETKAADAKVSTPADAQPAPTVVAALSPHKAEPQPKSSAEPAPVPTAASPDTVAPSTAAAPAEPNVAGADTL